MLRGTEETQDLKEGGHCRLEGLFSLDEVESYFMNVGRPRPRPKLNPLSG
jgi:hypothetical protein